MSRYIVFIALFAAIVVLRRHGMKRAFLWVWIPFFLAMPFAFWVEIPGLPDPNFMQAAILPILFALLRERGNRIEPGPMEALLLIYVVVRVVADFSSRGYSDAQNYAFYMLSALIGPYLMGRYLIDDRRMDIATAQAFVLMFLIFFPMFLYEAKFWVSPIFKVFSGFFPNAHSGLSIRWGLARTSGTFEHPILACILILTVYRLHRWLDWIGAWRQPLPGALAWIERRTRWMRLNWSARVTLALVLMALMTISRGPWIGGLVGAAIAMIGLARNRHRSLWITLGVLLTAGLIGQTALDAYITPEVGEVLSGEAQTMLYRKVMIDQYKSFLMDRLWTGWGLTGVPKIRGMESIDNAFFLMALQHGVMAVGVFITIFLYAIVSQLRFALRAPPGEPPLGFTFTGIYVMCFIAFATVYMGAQTEPMLFLLLGWGESVKRRGHASGAPPGLPAPRPTGPFRRVMT